MLLRTSNRHSIRFFFKTFHSLIDRYPLISSTSFFSCSREKQTFYWRKTKMIKQAVGLFLFTFINWTWLSSSSIDHSHLIEIYWQSFSNNPYERLLSSTVANVIPIYIDISFVIYYYYLEMPVRYKRRERERGISHLYWMRLLLLSIDNNDTLSDNLYGTKVYWFPLLHCRVIIIPDAY